MPARFEIGQRYVRKALHEQYGGQRQSGVVTPKAVPIILLVTGQSGRHNGYHDEWLDDGNMLRYFGEGRIGDMAFKGGNRAIVEHQAAGKELHLFEAQGKGILVYRGEMTCSAYEYVEGALDAEKRRRRAIVFLLTRIGIDPAQEGLPDSSESELMGASVDQLRELARKPIARTAAPIEARRWVYIRSRALREYVLCRAGGRCEGCRQRAPFADRYGRPFLEAHHTRRLSDGGPDDPQWVTALCPNCHRRAHHGHDAESFNARLIAKLAMLEANASVAVTAPPRRP